MNLNPGWVRKAVHAIHADMVRFAEIHLLRFPLRADKFKSVALYFSDESRTQPEASNIGWRGPNSSVPCATEESRVARRCSKPCQRI